MGQIHLKRVFCFLVLPMLIIVFCIILYKNTDAESRKDIIDDVVAYESVLICEGDTLWDIAKANLNQPTNAEICDYVEEIISINGLPADTMIHTGNYLLIPKYSSQQEITRM